MISLLWGRIPSWGSVGSQWHLHHKEVPSTSSAEMVALMVTGRWLLLCYPSLWNGWAVSTRSLTLVVPFSTSTEFQYPVKNICRQEKEDTTRQMTLQYSFSQGTLWYHNQLILLRHQVFNHVSFSLQGNTVKLPSKCWQFSWLPTKKVSFDKLRIVQSPTGREGERVRRVGLCLHEGMQLCLHLSLFKCMASVSKTSPHLNAFTRMFHLVKKASKSCLLYFKHQARHLHCLLLTVQFWRP